MSIEDKTKVVSCNNDSNSSFKKNYWPWNKEIEYAKSLCFSKNNRDWPRISVITPSYNQGQFIEETIRSVLLQDYPNLEYIVIDGGSTDNTLEIIERYKPWISYWVSEPDRGQAHAINKGIAESTGDIIAYLNSDDYYLTGTLFKVAETLMQNPQIDLFHGRCRYIDIQGNKIGEQFGRITHYKEILDLWNIWWGKRQFVQPEVFWTKRISDSIGVFQEELNYVMDYEYWCRILLAGGKVSRIDQELACFRFTPNQKSNHSASVANELLQVARTYYWDFKVPLTLIERIVFQGRWLYQTMLLKQIEQSLEQKNHKLVRLLRSVLLIIKYPQIIATPEFRHRGKKFLLKLFTNLSSS